MRCDVAENYMFLEIHNWWEFNVGKWTRIISFYIFLTGTRKFWNGNREQRDAEAEKYLL